MIGTGPRCNAITARGTPCQRPAVAGGPCAWHSRTRRPEPRVWARAKRWQLMTLIEEGWDDARIAERLGVTATAVHLARKRYGIPARNQTVLTSRAVADLLGLGCSKTIVWWIAQGWLKGRRGWAVGKNRVWMVREADLHAFLEAPEHWHRWQPERITDPALRAWTLGLRGEERFLTLGEAAEWLCRNRHICVQREAVASWAHRGRLAAVRNGRGNRQVRLSDLETFQQPAFGQGSRKQTWEPCARCGDPDGPIRRPCVTPARHQAARYGCDGLVCGRCYRRLRTVFERAHREGVAA